MLEGPDRLLKVLSKSILPPPLCTLVGHGNNKQHISHCQVTGTNLHEVIKTDLIQPKKLKFAAAPTEKRHEKSVRC